MNAQQMVRAAKREQFMLEHLGRLIGKKVEVITLDESADIGSVFGLRFDDGTVAWIMADAEGNGSGWLDIQKGK